MRSSRNILLIVLAAVVAGCGSTAPHRIDSEETTAEYSDRSYSSLMILAAYPDRTFRISAETVLAEEFKQRGINAVPSYDILPDLADVDDDAALRAAFAGTGHDGVLTVTTLDEGYDYDYGDYLATRGMVRILGGEPGAGTDLGALIAWAGSGEYELYVSLWDAGELVPVWQATTSSSAMDSETDDMRALVDFLSGKFREKGFVQ